MHPDEIPIIELRSRPWKHRDFGHMVAPNLKIVGWAPIPENFDELAAAVDGGEGEAEVPFEIEAAPAVKPAAAKAKEAPPQRKLQEVKPAPRKPVGNNKRTIRF